VGAGNLVIILLPSDETPVLGQDQGFLALQCKNAWINLKKTSANTFANAAYTKNPKNALTFDLDVSMGNIIFKEKQP
jgi:hypothetical protein